MDALTAARTYAQRGFPVFPVGVNKMPQTRHGVYDATTDAATLDRWYAGRPGRGIALAMGGPGRLIALDADVKHGLPGIQTYREIIPHDLGEPWQRTPSGGEHHIFTLPAGVRIGNGTSFLGPGLDHRGVGGHICTFTTAGYQWQREPFGTIPQLPAMVIDLLTTPKPRPQAAVTDTQTVGVSAESALARLAGAREGERNDTLNRTAFTFGRLITAGKLSEDDARRMLTETALSIGLTAYETERTIESGLRAGLIATGAIPQSGAIEAAFGCLRWALSAPWPGVRGLSERRVFIAHALIGLSCGQPVYGASMRRLAELANIAGVTTVKRANDRLLAAGRVDLVRLAVRGECVSNTYKLRTNGTVNQGEHTGTPANLATCTIHAQFGSAQGHDAFTRKGLGPTAGVVWDSLRTDGSATVKQLIERTGRGRRSIEKALAAMLRVVDTATGETLPMVAKVGRNYTALAVDLDAIARLLHCDGESLRRNDRHQREREAYIAGHRTQKARQQSGTLPMPQMRTDAEVLRTHDGAKRLAALVNVPEHGTAE